MFTIFRIVIFSTIIFNISSCASRKYNFKKETHLISLEIIDKIKENKKWEREFLRQLFLKCKILKIDNSIFIGNQNIKNNDRLFLVFLKTSNWIYYSDAEMLIRNIYNENFINENNDEFWEIYDKRIERKPSLRINHSIPWGNQLNEYNDKLFLLIGKPNEVLQEGFKTFDVWYLNGYEIKVTNLRDEIHITLNL